MNLKLIVHLLNHPLISILNAIKKLKFYQNLTHGNHFSSERNTLVFNSGQLNSTQSLNQSSLLKNMLSEGK